MKRKGIPGPYFKRRSGIYKIICIATGDTYVGKSKNLHQRWCQHRHSLNTKTHPNPMLQELYNAHGMSQFIMELVELIDDIDALETREVYWTDQLKPSMNVVDTKLSANDVAEIRKLNEEKIPLSEISSKYNISNKYLLDILRGNRW